MRRIRCAYGLLVLVVDLATETILIVDLVLQVEGVVLKAVTSLDALTGSLVLLSILLSLGNHALNLLRSQATLVVVDGDGLLLAGALVVSGNLEDTVRVKLEGNLDLRYTARRGRDTSKLELSKDTVILGHATLALKDLDQDNGLVISGRREDLALAGRDGGVAGDQASHDATGGLDTKSQRVDVHEDNLVSTLLTGEHTSLNGGTESNSLVRVDTLGGLLALEELLDKGLNLGDTGRATDENDVIDLRQVNLGVGQNVLDGLKSLLEKVVVQLLELGASQSFREVVALEESLNLNAGAHL
jgi:hypothetical protein